MQSAPHALETQIAVTLWLPQLLTAAGSGMVIITLTKRCADKVLLYDVLFGLDTSHKNADHAFQMRTHGNACRIGIFFLDRHIDAVMLELRT